MVKKKGLGKGLSALIEDSINSYAEAGQPLEVPIDNIDTNPLQPRSSIKTKDLKGLIESIREKGVIEPLIVRRIAQDSYQLIAGERRWHASREAGLKTVPVMIREATPVEMLELALIENLHREDLNPIEEAESYHRLAEEFSRTQEEIAALSGKDRSTVANLVRLLALPDPIQEDVRQGRISAGHARALLALEKIEQMMTVREQILKRRLSVRETEALVKKINRIPKQKNRDAEKDKAYFESLSDAMTRTLGAKVRIVHRGRRRIEISYTNNDELERLLNVMGVKTL